MKTKYLILAITVPAVVLADQATKIAAKIGLQPLVSAPDPGERFLTVIDGFFRLKYAENAGAAWGLGNAWSPAVRIPFFIVVTLLAIGLILYFVRRMEEDKRLLPVAFALVLAGAVGNLIDRIYQGRVVDFIDWYVRFDSPLDLGLTTLSAGEHHWPTFNIADIGISVGVALLFLELLFAKKPAQAGASPGRKK
ncbi:MAG TPA: signal peptidase II [Myxococcota bacterium]|nr:signal peptidase II [Myxococcota bacterium]HRY93111.1 signal peptidase II [Myxococcota bacterium]HSA20357.1 signal peptidase II [Myxococcota bacterium]